MALSGRSSLNPFAGSNRGGAGVFVTFQNAELVSDILNEIEDGLKSQTNREMRQAAKEIARDVVIPQLKRSARSSPMKIARAFAETARPKADRIVTVQIGGVNPPLEGFRRGRGVKRAKSLTTTGRDATSRNYRTSMAWGSEYGPFPGARVNNYGQPRREPGGYWVTQGIASSIPEATRRYEAHLSELVSTRSRYR